jgi:putative ABC transport system substrate-binding protein
MLHDLSSPGRYRKLWTCILAIIVGLSLNACEEKKPKVYRVGVLCDLKSFDSIGDGFKVRMTELGYVEGENITYEVYRLNSKTKGKQELVRKLASKKTDLIFAFPTEPAIAAKAIGREAGIPVVFCIAGIEENNLVESVRKPGGNITGVRFPGPDMVVKRLEVLMELAPWARRVYLPYDPSYSTTPPAVKRLRKFASSLGIELIEVLVTSVEDIQHDLEAREKSGLIGMNAIQIMPEALTQSPSGWAMITEFAAKHRIPIFGSAPFTVREGAVTSLAPDFYEAGGLAAPLVDKIFKGVPAGTIPVVSPDFYLRINYKCAREIGLEVPQGLLKMAHEIYR